MSYVQRTARLAYDNIAVGAATGKERTILGNAGSTEKFSGGSNVSIASTEPTSDYARNRMIASSGAGVTTLHPRENISSTQ